MRSIKQSFTKSFQLDLLISNTPATWCEGWSEVIAEIKPVTFKDKDRVESRNCRPLFYLGGKWQKSNSTGRVTGMSGAGKTVAIQSFGDLGYFTIDNMPPLLLKFIELMRHSPDNNKLAVVVDMPGPFFFEWESHHFGWWTTRRPRFQGLVLGYHW